MLENYNEDALIRNVLLSKRDYVVDYKIINEPAPENGGSTYELLNHILADALSQKGINILFKFGENKKLRIYILKYMRRTFAYYFATPAHIYLWVIYH